MVYSEFQFVQILNHPSRERVDPCGESSGFFLNLFGCEWRCPGRVGTSNTADNSNVTCLLPYSSINICRFELHHTGLDRICSSQLNSKCNCHLQRHEPNASKSSEGYSFNSTNLQMHWLMDDNEEQRWFSGGFATADPQQSHPRPEQQQQGHPRCTSVSLFKAHTIHLLLQYKSSAIYLHCTPSLSLLLSRLSRFFHLLQHFSAADCSAAGSMLERIQH